MRKIIIVFIAALLGMYAQAQTAQNEYLEAKRLFDEEQYLSAKAAFGSLVTVPNFGKYAAFYYALSAYRLGDNKAATDMWKQILKNNPDWNQNEEVLYWLSYASFEDTLYSQGIKYAKQLSAMSLRKDTEERMVRKYIGKLPAARVDSLMVEYPEDRLLAELLLQQLNNVPYQERDFVRINSLIEKWDFSVEEYAVVDLPVVRKDTYNIAVLLPFLFESLEDTRMISQNNLVMDMYQGMQLAAEDLAGMGRPVNLFPYDTRRKKEVTEKILSSKGFEQTDLIIGPLYTAPNEAVNAYTKKMAINTFNPISSNADVIGDNPYSFLVRPSYSTLAQQTAELAILENTTNHYAMIFYEESERDSIFAAVYKQKIEEAGFEVVLYQAITSENNKELLDELTAKYYAYYSKSEADSLMRAGQYVRDRRIRRDELRRMNRDESFDLPISYDTESNAIVYYQEHFRMAPDSIGHIVAATRSNLFANNMISAIDGRGDSIKLYGYGDWLEFTMLSYNQLDRLGVALSNPEFIDTESYLYQDVKERLTQKFKTNPSINHYRGYEIVWFTGRMLHRHGKYFQRGLRSGTTSTGKVFEGHQYGIANDNQVVPIVRFKNAKLEVVNRAQYENREE